MRHTIAAVLFLSAAGVARAEPPANMFDARCADCHGRDGRARTAKGLELGAADLTRSKLELPAIQTAIQRGRGRMKAPARDLEAEKQQALAEYVKTLRETLESVDTGELLKK